LINDDLRQEQYRRSQVLLGSRIAAWFLSYLLRRQSEKVSKFIATNVEVRCGRLKDVRNKLFNAAAQAQNTEHSAHGVG